MTDARRGDATALAMDPARFAEVERLAAFELGNALLLAQLDLQRAFGMPAAVHMIARTDAPFDRRLRGKSRADGSRQQRLLAPSR